MPYEIAHSEDFPRELGIAPRKVQNAYQKTILPELRRAPETAAPPRIKKLVGYKALWRYRVSDDWRLVYKVDRSEHLVTMLMLGHRNAIYDRLGSTTQGTPGIRIVANAPELMETPPTPTEIGTAVMQLAAATPNAQNNTTPSSPLPTALTSALLASWSIPAKYAPDLIKVTTQEQLWELRGTVPETILERVIYNLWPLPLERVLQRPTRVPAHPADVIAAATGTRSLNSFLLKLDDSQKAFVARFAKHGAQGPWLIKGGPGSGKSTVALYCIHALLDRQATKMPGLVKPPRILYTTYTNALVNAASQLLNELPHTPGAGFVTVRTIDKLVSTHSPLSATLKYATSPTDWRPALRASIAKCSAGARGVSFSDSDTDFLLGEIDWIILGNDLQSSTDYENATRSGRGRRISLDQRKLVWRIYEDFVAALREKGLARPGAFAAEAARRITPEYDYVFIDEAQDLTPAQLRLAIGLCASPQGVFLTADGNQSIYGNGISWRSVADTLRFNGRITTLTRNYRTTREIWDALHTLAPNSADADPETLEMAGATRGPHPMLITYTDPQVARARLNSLLKDALSEERLTPGCIGVLCPTNYKATEFANWLEPLFGPLVMTSRSTDLAYPGAKVMTIHASKGLQFPIVVVAGFEERKAMIGTSALDSVDLDAKERRVLFVGCSRAMRRLIVLSNSKSPSPLTKRLSDEHWEIEVL